ncbi:putative sodium/hydrogen exchanger 2-like isoform X1 [Capsicum annuum]|nr:putative sodium/hydrogen exchanger 2-like isoform X1 [Capsicum annuum]
MDAETAYTLPVYDTLNIDSPTIGKENLNFPAMSFDIPDCVENEISYLTNECEEEVVLDSDDERMHGTEVASVSKLRSSDDKRYTERLDKWKVSPVSKQTYVGCLRRSKNLFKYMDSARSTPDVQKTNQRKQISEINGGISPQIDDICVTKKPRVEEDCCRAAEITKDEISKGNVETEALTAYGVDGDKDFPLHSFNIELPKLSKVESQVPEELSEANALDFIDHFLSVYNEDALSEVKAGGVKKIVSPPIFSRGGPQRLASRVNVQNAAKNSGVFDWPERQSDSANGSFSRHRKILTYHRKNYGLKKQKVSSVQSNKEPTESTTELNKAEPKFLVEGHMNVQSNVLRKSDEQFDMGPFEQQVDNDGNRSDVLDTYDVGLDTQLAAEAMESLLHAPPLKTDAVCAPPIPKASVVKEGEYPERAISREFNIDDSSPEPTLCGSAEIELLRGKTRRFSSVLPRTRHQVSSNFRSLESPTTNYITESNIPKKRRTQYELGELNNNLFKVAAVRGQVLKSGTNTSRKARKVSMNKRGEICQSVAATLSGVKLENWVSKGKRTQRGARRLSNGSSNLYPPLIPADQGNDFNIPVFNDKAGRRQQSLEFKRQNQSSSEKTQSGFLSIQSASKPYSSMCKYSVTSQKMTPMDVKRVESTDSAKLNEMTSISPNLLIKGVKSDVVSNRISDSSYCLNDHKQRKQHIRSLSKSPLSQELIRLGYVERLPDFLPRGSRRQKGAGDICVLFSQSLDSKLIKHQKKILARLGFKSTSDCSDATHFVTDSFVRSRNMLEAIACGKPIVTHLWLERCGRASCFVDEKNYILRDAKKEKEIGFNMPASLAHARKHPLLEGRRVIITPSAKPNRDTLLTLVKAVHGEVVDESNSKITCDDLLILSCEEDYKICIPYLEKRILVYSSELLLNGIVIQKLEYNSNILHNQPAIHLHEMQACFLCAKRLKCLNS